MTDNLMELEIAREAKLQEKDPVIDALVEGGFSEDAEFEEGDDDSEVLASALVSICASAQQDTDFGPAAVQQVLETLGLEEFWTDAEELLAEENADREEATQPGGEVGDFPAPEDTSETERPSASEPAPESP